MSSDSHELQKPSFPDGGHARADTRELTFVHGLLLKIDLEDDAFQLAVAGVRQHDVETLHVQRAEVIRVYSDGELLEMRRVGGGEQDHDPGQRRAVRIVQQCGADGSALDADLAEAGGVSELERAPA